MLTCFGTVGGADIATVGIWRSGSGGLAICLSILNSGSSREIVFDSYLFVACHYWLARLLFVLRIVLLDI